MLSAALASESSYMWESIIIKVRSVNNVELHNKLILVSMYFVFQMNESDISGNVSTSEVQIKCILLCYCIIVAVLTINSLTTAILQASVKMFCLQFVLLS